MYVRYVKSISFSLSPLECALGLFRRIGSCISPGHRPRPYYGPTSRPAPALRWPRLWRIFFSLKNKKQRQRGSDTVVDGVSLRCRNQSLSRVLSLALLSGRSHWFPGEVGRWLPCRQWLHILGDHHPGDPWPFLDGHCRTQRTTVELVNACDP